MPASTRFLHCIANISGRCFVSDESVVRPDSFKALRLGLNHGDNGGGVTIFDRLEHPLDALLSSKLKLPELSAIFVEVQQRKLSGLAR